MVKRALRPCGEFVSGSSDQGLRVFVSLAPVATLLFPSLVPATLGTDECIRLPAVKTTTDDARPRRPRMLSRVVFPPLRVVLLEIGRVCCPPLPDSFAAAGHAPAIETAPQFRSWRESLETGLAVTYARVFTDSKHYTPVPREWVPIEHTDLHEQLMERRNRYHAHIDRSPRNIHRRKASDSGEGWFAVGFPDPLTPEQLDELVDLARKLHLRVDAELDRERRDDARAVHTAVTPFEEKTPD
jgi:hypothetical protein